MVSVAGGLLRSSSFSGRKSEVVLELGAILRRRTVGNSNKIFGQGGGTMVFPVVLEFFNCEDVVHSGYGIVARGPV